MRAPIALLLVAAVLAGAGPSAFGAELYDYYLVVDTSGSMGGRPAGGGNANIMPRVKEALDEFVAKLPLGSRVLMFPFDARVHDKKIVSLDREEDRQALSQCVEALQPTGSQTCICGTLASVFGDIRAARLRPGGAETTSTILLYTDGLEECRVSRDGDGSRTPSLRQLLQEYRLLRGPNDYLYYTTLGVDLPALERKLLGSTPGVRLVTEPRGRVEPIALVTARPTVLDFGAIGSAGSSTRQLSLGFGARLRGQSLSASLVKIVLAPEEAVRIEPEQFKLEGPEVALTLKLLNRASFSQAAFSGELVLRGTSDRLHVTPERLPIRFSTLPPLSFSVSSPTTLPAALGEIPFASDGTARAEIRYLVQPSASIRSSGARFQAEVALDPANPAPLEAGSRVRLEAGKHRGRSLILDAASREFRLVIDLQAPAPPPGQYKGTLLFRSETAEVAGTGIAALPGGSRASQTTFSFVLPGERFVRVVPPAGGFPFGMGTVTMKSKGPVVLVRPLSLVFSPEAVSRGATVRADLEMSEKNPAALVAGEHAWLMSGGNSGKSVKLDSAMSQLDIKIELPASAKPGIYQGRIVLWPNGTSIDPAGLEPVSGSGWAKAVSFQFEVDLEKQLSIRSDTAGESLGVLVPGGETARLQRRYTLVWSDSAQQAGATAKAKLRWQSEGEFASLEAGVQRGSEVTLTPEHKEMTLTIDGTRGLGIGTYSGSLELTGEGCAVQAEDFESPASSGAPATARLAFRVPRPAWIGLLFASVVLLLIGSWGYAASLPRFGASVRLSVEAGPGSGGSYYLRGHQGRFSKEVTVGGRGKADLFLEGLAGLAFSVRIEGGGRCRVIALSPLELRLPESLEEGLGTGQSRPLPDGSTIRIAELTILFSEHA